MSYGPEQSKQLALSAERYRQNGEDIGRFLDIRLASPLSLAEKQAIQDALTVACYADEVVDNDQKSISSYAREIVRFATDPEVDLPSYLSACSVEAERLRDYSLTLPDEQITELVQGFDLFQAIVRQMSSTTSANEYAGMAVEEGRAAATLLLLLLQPDTKTNPKNARTLEWLKTLAAFGNVVDSIIDAKRDTEANRTKVSSTGAIRTELGRRALRLFPGVIRGVRVKEIGSLARNAVNIVKGVR